MTNQSVCGSRIIVVGSVIVAGSLLFDFATAVLLPLLPFCVVTATVVVAAADQSTAVVVAVVADPELNHEAIWIIVKPIVGFATAFAAELLSLIADAPAPTVAADRSTTVVAASIAVINSAEHEN